MTVATACSVLADSAAAFAAAYGALRARLGGADPDLLLFYYTVGHDGAALARAAAALPPRVQAQGATTCLGVIADDGVFRGETVLGMLGLRRAGLAAGAALRPKGADPRAAAADAMRAALDAAGRPGEMPDLVLLTATAGDEEAALEGVAAIVGPRVPVFGGSASGPPERDARGRLPGRVAVRGLEAEDAMALTALFAPMPISRTLHGGCVPTGFAGVVSAVAAPRVVTRIDGRPAAAVYAGWLDAHAGLLPTSVVTDLLPLGREVGRVGEYPLHVLSHVTEVRGDGSLGVMTDLAVGDEVRLMAGCTESVAGRPARAVEAAIDLQCGDACTLSGGLMALCAGLLPRIAGDLDEVRRAVGRSMMGRPFLCAFTFGEQGGLGDRAVHGNLMISTLVFGG